jgi:hypothetical protein
MHYATATKPNRLVLFRETVAIYCENQMENRNSLFVLNEDFWYVQAGGTYSNHLGFDIDIFHIWTLTFTMACNHKNFFKFLG